MVIIRLIDEMIGNLYHPFEYECIRNNNVDNTVMWLG
jgi:hypothetical protein